MEYFLTALELSGGVAGNAILVWVTYIFGCRNTVRNIHYMRSSYNQVRNR